jgi:uncharacterized protein (TIGR03435 family)
MMRALIVERFQLVAQLEQRAQSGYALVLARRDGKLGPQLRRSATKCGPSPLLPCGYLRLAIFGELIARMDPITDVAARGLTVAVEAQVVDETGLQGNFDVDLRWSPTALPSSFANQPPPDPDRPSIFAAVEEQLGLKLVPRKTLVDVLVVKGIQRLTPN